MSTAEPIPAGTAAHATVLEVEHELEQATSARPHDPTRLADILQSHRHPNRDRFARGKNSIHFFPMPVQDTLGSLVGRIARRSGALIG